MCIIAAGAAAGHGMMAKLCAPGAGIQPAGTQARSASAQAKSASVKRRAQRAIRAALGSPAIPFHRRISRFDAMRGGAVPESLERPAIRFRYSAMRTTEEVLHDHLKCRCEHDVEGDLEANYADHVVVLSKDGVFRGHDGIRQTAGILHRNLPEASYNYDLVRCADDYAMLSWSAKASDGSRTCHGADSYVIRDGLIVAQTIQFEVEPKSG
jgi:hypothetical protein